MISMMSWKRCHVVAAVLGVLWSGGTAIAEEIPVSYWVDAVDLKKQAPAGTILTFELHEDSACSSLFFSEAVDISSVSSEIEKLKIAPVKGAAKPPKPVRINTVLDGVTPTSPMYLRVTGAGVTPIGSDCQVQVSGIPGPAGPSGAGAGTFTINIPAITCTAQSGAISGDTSVCTGGGTVRTEGTNQFPCVLRGEASLLTHACPLVLPDGAQIDEVRLHGLDTDAAGYFEGAIWRTAASSFGVEYISPSFAGTWQTSGIAAAAGATNVLLYSSADPPHVISPGYRYLMGIGVKGTGTLLVYGIQVTYTIP